MHAFLAVDLPTDIRAKLADAISEARSAGLHASFVRPEQMHVTMLFLGDKTESEIAEIKGKLAGLDFPSIKIAVAGIGFFPDERRPRVFWAGAQTDGDALTLLHREICRLLGIQPEKNFVGHVTLARIRDRVDASMAQRLRQALGASQFGEFRAVALALKMSTLSPDGAVYEDLNTFSLKES